MARIQRQPRFSTLVFLSLLFAILAFLPVTPRPDFAIRDSLTLNRITEISFLLISACLITFAGVRLHISRNFDRAPVYLVGIFGLWSLTSTLWSDSPLYTFGKSLQLLLLVYITVLFSSVTAAHPTIRSEIFRNRFAYALLLAALLIVGTNFAISGSLFNFSEASSTRAARLSLGTSHPLETADFVAITIIAVLASGFSFRRKVVCIVLISVPLVLTDGRTPMAVLLFTVFAMAYLKMGAAGRVGAIVVLALTAISGAMYLALSGAALSPDQVQGLASLNNRTLNWEYALGVAADNALGGVGYLASRESLIGFATWAGNDVKAWGGRAHNAYIEVFLTTGLVGLIVLSVFVIYAARKAYASKNLLLFGVFTYVAVRSIFDALLFTPDLPTFAVILLLMITPAVQRKRISQLAYSG